MTWIVARVSLPIGTSLRTDRPATTRSPASRMLVTRPTAMPGDHDGIARVQRGGLGELRGVAGVPEADHLHQQCRGDDDAHHRQCAESQPGGVVGLQRPAPWRTNRRIRVVGNQPLTVFLHLGVCQALFPGVAALTMIVVMSLRPGKNPVAFRSHR